MDLNTTIEYPEMPELTFEEDTHTYKLGGLVIPSVSQVMEPLSRKKYDGISEETLNRAADKGTSVHNCIENWIKFGIEDINPDNAPYFTAFKSWWEKTKPEVVASEVRTYHKIMRYGGTIDLLAYIGGELTLIDYKSTYTVYDMTCGVQLEAYKQALNSHGIYPTKKMILHLKRDAKFSEKFFDLKDPRRWQVFGSLKDVFDYMS